MLHGDSSNLNTAYIDFCPCFPDICLVAGSRCIVQVGHLCRFHPQKTEIWGNLNSLWKCGKTGEIWQKFIKMCIFALISGLIKCSKCLVLTHKFTFTFTSIVPKLITAATVLHSITYELNECSECLVLKQLYFKVLVKVHCTDQLFVQNFFCFRKQIICEIVCDKYLVGIVHVVLIYEMLIAKPNHHMSSIQSVIVALQCLELDHPSLRVKGNISRNRKRPNWSKLLIN